MRWRRLCLDPRSIPLGGRHPPGLSNRVCETNTNAPHVVPSLVCQGEGTAGATCKAIRLPYPSSSGDFGTMELSAAPSRRPGPLKNKTPALSSAITTAEGCTVAESSRRVPHPNGGVNKTALSECSGVVLAIFAIATNSRYVADMR